MKKITLVMWIVFCFSSLTDAAAYSGGSGTPEDPYKIANAADLLALAADANDYNDCFILVNNINLAGYTFSRALIAPDINTADSIFQGKAFSGIFDGNGHSINYFKLNTSGLNDSYLGLFGYIDANGLISNLFIEDVNITAGTGSFYTGGLCGANYGNVIRCRATGKIRNGNYIAGLCGKVPGNIINSYTKMTVTGNYGVGGLCADNTGTVINCFASGNVTGNLYVGGLSGGNGGDVINCYSISTVTGIQKTGGLCGNNSTSGMYIGTIISSYFLITAGPNNGAGTPLTDSQMKQQASYVNWDFMNEKVNGTSSNWKIESNTYPQLSIFTGPYEFVGQGTAADPYLVSDANSLGAIWQKPYSSYKFINDVNLTGIKWSIAVVPFFRGNFDGDNHIISKLSITGNSYLGLFGRTNFATIKNIGIQNADVSGSDDYVSGLCGRNDFGNIINSHVSGTFNGSVSTGGLCGANHGSIKNCYALGNAAGSAAVGVLCGFNTRTIANCYSSGNANGSYMIGGICGENGGSITDCYAKGVITAEGSLGGLCGANLNPGSITNCYAICTVTGDYAGGLCGYDYEGNYINCYFLDTAAPDNGLGEPLTNSQLKQKANFTGWDFLGETANGTEDIWRMCVDGDNYPKLSFEFKRGDFVCPDGVDMYDLYVFASQWLCSELNYDSYTADKKHIVNFLDYANSLNSINFDKSKFSGFFNEWLKYNAYNADIIGSDDFVNFLDFAVFAENWMQ
ncbi:MAG: GLUG motif-containing protein [Phycisphaerales bacterium]